jgi:O-Antigen ligase
MRPFALGLVAAGLVLAIGAAVAAPTGALLPGPRTHPQEAGAALVLAVAFMLGVRFPIQSFYGVIVLTVVDGAIRKWAYNEIVVYLLKDFLLLGVYAAVIPRLSREKLARPWWLLAPLGGVLLLAVLYVARSPSLSQAAIGLRSYFIYVPLLWVAPAIVDRRSRGIALLVLFCAVGIVEVLLGAVQSLAGPGILNKLVSGAQPGIVTVNHVPYFRPPGTFMQTADLSFAVVLAFVAAAALLVWRSSRRLQVLALATVSVTFGSIVFTAARTILVSAVLVLAALVIVLLVQRRIILVAVVGIVAALGLAVSIEGFPYAERHVVPTVKSWFTAAPQLPADQLRKLVPLRLRVSATKRVDLRVPPAVLVAGRGHTGNITFQAYTTGGTPVAVSVPAAALRGKSTPPRAPEEHGTVPVVSGAIVKPVAPSVGSNGGFLSRSTDFQTTGAAKSGALWTDRLRPQLKLMSHQRLVGHGTGTMTLGAQYANPSTHFPGESDYLKIVWELGWPGLILFVWFVVAAIWASLRSALAVEGWRRACAIAGVGISVLVALWMTLNFALDTPNVAQAFYLFLGLALAASVSAGARGFGPERA